MSSDRSVQEYAMLSTSRKTAPTVKSDRGQKKNNRFKTRADAHAWTYYDRIWQRYLGTFGPL